MSHWDTNLPNAWVPKNQRSTMNTATKGSVDHRMTALFAHADTSISQPPRKVPDGHGDNEVQPKGLQLQPLIGMPQGGSNECS